MSSECFVAIIQLFDLLNAAGSQKLLTLLSHPICNIHLFAIFLTVIFLNLAGEAMWVRNAWASTPKLGGILPVSQHWACDAFKTTCDE